jgi:hypothetical protein
MIIYNVTINIEDDIKNEWIEWMKEVHIPDVMATNLFTEFRFCRVMVNEESGSTYSIQYSCKDMITFENYRDNYAPALQQEHLNKFGGKFVAFRTLLEQV